MSKSKKIGLFLIIIGAFLMPIGGYLTEIGRSDWDNAVKAMNGELNPFPVDTTKPFDVMLSEGVHLIFSAKDLENGFILSKMFPPSYNFTDNPLHIQFIDGKMFVSADVVNSKHELIAKIVNNEWKTVDPSTLSFWDRNYNSYAFEIIGPDNLPALQVIMVGPNQIQIGGLFYTKTGSVYIAPQGPDAAIFVNVGDQRRQSAENIPRIFYYPALTNPSNLGKMVNPVYPSTNPQFEPILMTALGITLVFLGGVAGVFGIEKYKAPKGRRKGHSKK